MADVSGEPRVWRKWGHLVPGQVRVYLFLHSTIRAINPTGMLIWVGGQVKRRFLGSICLRRLSSGEDPLVEHVLGTRRQSTQRKASLMVFQTRLIYPQAGNPRDKVTRQKPSPLGNINNPRFPITFGNLWITSLIQDLGVHGHPLASRGWFEIVFFF